MLVPWAVFCFRTLRMPKPKFSGYGVAIEQIAFTFRDVEQWIQQGSHNRTKHTNTHQKQEAIADFKHRNGGYNPHQDTLRLLSRHEQTMIFRLRTGHCRLRSHMKKIGIEQSALCPCGLEAQTAAQVLQSWPLHKRERESTWPTESSLGNKLHGTATDIRLTVRFIAMTGLQI